MCADGGGCIELAEHGKVLPAKLNPSTVVRPAKAPLPKGLSICSSAHSSSSSALVPLVGGPTVMGHDWLSVLVLPAGGLPASGPGGLPTATAPYTGTSSSSSSSSSAYTSTLTLSGPAPAIAPPGLRCARP